MKLITLALFLLSITSTINSSKRWLSSDDDISTAED